MYSSLVDLSEIRGEFDLISKQKLPCQILTTNRAVTRRRRNAPDALSQGWPTVAHCMFRGGAFQV